MLVISDAVVPSGFARVVRGVLDPIREDYDIEQLGVSYFGDPHDWPWKIYPAHIGGDSFGIPRIPFMLKKVKPDLIFIVSNLSRISAYMKKMGEAVRGIPVIAYSALEAAPADANLVPDLAEIDRLVFYTEFSCQVFRDAVDACEVEGEFSVPRHSALPHGVDTAVFHPFEPEEADREAVKRRAKERLFRGDEEHREAFTVLNANRNEPRKRIDITIQGFAEFARDKDASVKLHLHMGNPDMGWDLASLSKQYGIYERLILTSRARDSPNVDLEEMNLIYNAADIGLNTSSSEGWGLVAFEHAATRSAQVMARHASLTELWSGTAEMVEPVVTLFDPQSRCEQHMVSPTGVAAALNKLYDQHHRQEVADRCYAHATQESLRWSHISEQWAAMFREVLDDYEKRRVESPPPV